MHIDELHARHGRRGKYSSRHRVGNVVEFQIEKNARSQLRHLADRFGSSGCEQLAANFEHADKIRHLLVEVQRCGQRVKIEGHNQAAAWMGVKGQGSGRARNIYFWLSSARSRLGGSCISSSRTWLTPEWIRPIFRATR